MRLKLKMKILEKFPSQIVAARILHFEEARLSKIVRGHVDPTAQERAKLIAEFGASALRLTQQGSDQARI